MNQEDQRLRAQLEAEIRALQDKRLATVETDVRELLRRQDDFSYVVYGRLDKQDSMLQTINAFVLKKMPSLAPVPSKARKIKWGAMILSVISFGGVAFYHYIQGDLLKWFWDIK